MISIVKLVSQLFFPDIAFIIALLGTTLQIVAAREASSCIGLLRLSFWGIVLNNLKYCNNSDVIINLITSYIFFYPTQTIVI